jgi:hypothetical protein
MGIGTTTASNYTISGNGKGTLANNPNNVACSGNVCSLIWSSGEMMNGGDITVTVNNSNVQDSAGNKWVIQITELILEVALVEKPQL